MTADSLTEVEVGGDDIVAGKLLVVCKILPGRVWVFRTGRYTLKVYFYKVF